MIHKASIIFSMDVKNEYPGEAVWIWLLTSWQKCPDQLLIRKLFHESKKNSD